MREPDATPRPDPRRVEEPGVAELVRQLARQSATLVRQEIELARTEVGNRAGRAARGAAGVVAWGAVALVGGLVTLVFGVLLLGDLLNNHWLAALIVGALLTLAGGGLALRGVRRMRRTSLAPEVTLQTLRQDRVWAQSEIDQLKRDLA